MFMGTAYNSIDEKNRMIVPSKLRAGLGAEMPYKSSDFWVGFGESGYLLHLDFPVGRRINI